MCVSLVKSSGGERKYSVTINLLLKPLFFKEKKKKNVINIIYNFVCIYRRVTVV